MANPSPKEQVSQGDDHQHQAQTQAPPPTNKEVGRGDTQPPQAQAAPPPATDQGNQGSVQQLQTQKMDLTNPSLTEHRNKDSDLSMKHPDNFHQDSSPRILTPYQLFERDRFAGNQELVRRHSVSIIDRAPPPADSLAAVILANNLAVRSSLLSSIADMKDSLSDFNSCVESQSTSDTSDTSDASEEELGSLKGVPKTANEKKRAKARFQK